MHDKQTDAVYRYFSLNQVVSKSEGGKRRIGVVSPFWNEETGYDSSKFQLNMLSGAVYIGDWEDCVVSKASAHKKLAPAISVLVKSLRATQRIRRDKIATLAKLQELNKVETRMANTTAETLELLSEQLHELNLEIGVGEVLY